MNWTKDRVERLREIAAAGGSYQDAADELGVSRDAVHGKADREGISFQCAEELRVAKISRACQRSWDRLTPRERDRRLSTTLRLTASHRRAAERAHG